MFEMLEDHYIIKSVGFGFQPGGGSDLVYRRNLDFASSPCSRFVRKYGVERLAIIKFHKSVRGSEIHSLLLDGLKINGEQFSFLGCSTSGLKERKAYLWRGSPAEAEKVLIENGEFDRIKTVSKRMAREGLLFSAIDYTGVEIQWEDIIEEEDIERNGYNFTDGCGEMSESVARRVCETIPSLEDCQYPSVLQIRLQGMKGVLALNPRLERAKILVRPSQVKFKTKFDCGLGVAGFSQPYTFAHLNKQFIILLSGLGVPDQSFLEIHDELFSLLEKMTSDKEAAMVIMQWRNKYEVSKLLMRMTTLEFNTLTNGGRGKRDELYKEGRATDVMRVLINTRQRLIESDIKRNPDGSEKEKLKILVRKSRLLYGVCDQDSGGLQYGHCQVRISSEGGLVTSLKGKAVVARSPAYLLGDLRVLEMVHVPGLEHLVDCVVFPTSGPRPHADEMGGGDLDGDKFFVCWDQRLIPPEVRPAEEYPPAQPRKEKSVTLESRIRYFANQSNLQGYVDTLYNKWVDLLGPASDQCRRLGILFGRAIDAAKSGEKLIIPENLKEPKRESGERQEWIWIKLTKLAQERKEKIRSDLVKNFEMISAIVSEDFVLNVLTERQSNISQFEKFMMAWKFCLTQAKEESKAQKMFENRFLKFVNFGKMSMTERIEAVHVGVRQSDVFNALKHSDIILGEDLDLFRTSLQDIGWCFYSSNSRSGFDPESHLLTLTEGEGSLVVFEIPDYVIVAFLFLDPLKEGEGVPIEPGSIKSFWISRQFGIKRSFVCPDCYCYDLSANRFQLYQDRERKATFFWFRSGAMVVEEMTLSVSIDLTRFGGNKVRVGRNFPKSHPLIRKAPFSSVEVFRLCRPEPVYDPVDVVNDLEVAEMTEAPGWTLSGEERDPSADILEILDRLDQPSDCQVEEDVGLVLSVLQDLTRRSVPATVQTDQRVRSRLTAFLTRLPRPQLWEGLRVSSQLTRLGQPDLAETVLARLRSTNTFRLEEIRAALERWQTFFYLDSQVLWEQMLAFFDSAVRHFQGKKVELYLLRQMKHNLVHLMTQLKEFKAGLSQHDKVVRGLRLVPLSEQTEEQVYCLEGPGHASWLKEGDQVAVSLEKYFTNTFRSVVCLARVVQVTPVPCSVRLTLEEDCSPLILQPEFLSEEDTLVLHSLSQVNVTVYSRVLARAEKFLGASQDNLLPWLADFPSQDNQIRPERTTGPASSCLNAGQSEAVRRSENQRLTMIQGPPGTGKTQVAVAIINTAVSAGAKVLVVAETNIAVDNILRRLVVGQHSGLHNPLRLGKTESVDADLINFTLEGRLEEVAEKTNRVVRYQNTKTGASMLNTREAERILRESSVVLTTCAGAGSPELRDQTFQLVLVDEATQVREELLLLGLSYGAERLVMIGDPRQLGPLVTLSDISWLSEEQQTQLEAELVDSPFTRLYNSGDYRFLDTQYRMHPAIADFPSREFYQGNLKTEFRTDQNPVEFPWPDQTRPLCFLQVEGRERRAGPSYSNQEEVEAVKSVLARLFSSPALVLTRREVCVLSLYSGQVRALRQASLGVEVATIDSYQGRENTFIIVSTVRAKGRLGKTDLSVVFLFQVILFSRIF